MKLSELIGTKEILAGGKVKMTVKKSLPWLEYLKIASMADAEERGIAFMTARIVKWDLTDDKGKALPITLDTVKILPREVAQEVVAAMNESDEAARKKKTR